MPSLFIFTFIAAAINSVSNVSSKFVVASGKVRTLPATFLTQIISGMIAVTCLLVWRIPWETAAMPFIFGVVMVAMTGFILTMAAFAREDASVVGPVLGLKVIALAVLESLVNGRGIGAGVWLGALLSVVGITLISQHDRWSLHPRDLLRPGVLMMALAAVIFSSSDMLLKGALNRWHEDFFAVTAYITAGQGLYSVLALAILMRLPGPLPARWGYAPTLDWGALREIRWPLLVSAASLFGYQLFFFLAFARGQQLTLINILYNVRGLLMVLIMAFLVLGQSHTIERAGWRAYVYRGAGALLTLSSIALATLWR